MGTLDIIAEGVGRGYRDERARGLAPPTRVPRKRPGVLGQPTGLHRHRGRRGRIRVALPPAIRVAESAALGGRDRTAAFPAGADRRHPDDRLALWRDRARLGRGAEPRARVRGDLFHLAFPWFSD